MKLYNYPKYKHEVIHQYRAYPRNEKQEKIGPCDYRVDKGIMVAVLSKEMDCTWFCFYEGVYFYLPRTHLKAKK